MLFRAFVIGSIRRYPPSASTAIAKRAIRRRASLRTVKTPSQALPLFPWKDPMLPKLPCSSTSTPAIPLRLAPATSLRPNRLSSSLKLFNRTTPCCLAQRTWARSPTRLLGCLPVTLSRATRFLPVASVFHRQYRAEFCWFRSLRSHSYATSMLQPRRTGSSPKCMSMKERRSSKEIQ